jgi:hypothetical protein
VKVHVGVPEGAPNRRSFGVRLDRSDQDDEKPDRREEDACLLREVELLSSGEDDRGRDEGESRENDGDPDQYD